MIIGICGEYLLRVGYNIFPVIILILIGTIMLIDLNAKYKNT